MLGFSAPQQQKVKNTTTKYDFLYILLCIASKSLKSPGNNFSGIFGKFHYINLRLSSGSIACMEKIEASLHNVKSRTFTSPFFIKRINYIAYGNTAMIISYLSEFCPF